tara:strand:- start:116 stop:310 length:195 start_codon:yes stop_codon:yes gene_type:complete
MTYLINDITFYKVDDEGNEELNEDGTTKVYRIKQGTRVKALEYLTDEFDDDIMEQERTNNEKLI